MKNRRIVRGLGAVVLTTIVTTSGLVATPSPSSALGQPAEPEDIPAVDGQWGPVEDWPLIAIHAALDANGRVVTYGTDGDGRQTGRFIYDIWTPNASAAVGHNTLANTTETDLFCSLQLNRFDTGEMVLFGGDNWTGDSTNNMGNPDIVSLNPDTNQLTQLPGMQRSRWYATGTTLPDGSMYIQGGDFGADHPELWIPGQGSRLLDLDTSGLSWWYPRNFLLPDGRIFGVDVDGRMYYIAADLSQITMVGQLGQDRWGYGTTAVMFAPGRILHFGGETNTAVILDVNGVNPVVTPIAAPAEAREWVNSTLLPDGRVLATGGASYYTAGQLDGRPLSEYNVTNAAEIWDPATGQWSIETSGVAARLYHSTALLLTDGRVLVAGGGAPGPVNSVNAEIFSPDYLHSVQGGATVRPQIEAVSSTDLRPGERVAIDIDSDVDIARVTLLKSGSVTHSINMEQRISDLAFTVVGETLHATLPASGTELSPGFYLLSAITTAGVPSESVMIRVEPALNLPASAQTAMAQVERLYRAYFLRRPDTAGLQYWVNQAVAGADLAGISDAFAGSAEFAARYGNLSDPAFVETVYTNVVGRPSDPAGLQYWTAQLGAGMTRGQLMLAFSESAEFINLINNGGVPAAPAAPATPPAPVPQPDTPGPQPAVPVPNQPYAPEINRLYLAYFQRDPDADGLQYWTGQRVAGLPLAAVSQAFADSAEFIARYGAASDAQFIDLIYLNVLGRPAEPEGHAYWVGQLGIGNSRGEIMVGFSESAEFIASIG